MANTTSSLSPRTEEFLKEFGERIRLARHRRRLQAKQVAERAGMTEVILRRVERGMPGVTIGAYLAVLQVLQLQGDIEKWAMDDPVGRHLQDTETFGGMRPRKSRRVPKAEPDDSAPNG
jgi:transcriptional regulator with XRE-family HTH domain